MMTVVPWKWPILGPIFREAFRERDQTPVPTWASKKVFLSRKITTKPGYYDPEEFPWTWEYQDMFRTRQAFWRTDADGATVLCEDGDCGDEVHQVTWMKSSVAGVTEASLNGIRWIADNDPQNVIFSIDNRVEAGNINEVRLQPTLRQLGHHVFTDNEDDAGKFLLKLQRMLVYFLGSYSSGAFANKLAEVAIADELEEHGSVSGDTSSRENLRSRLKSAERPFLALLSKPKMSGGPIHSEYEDGTQCVYEIPCPHCGGYQQLVSDNLKFGHCKDLTGEWDKERVLKETHFECVHCKGQIEEHHKRWFNDRSRRRWRRTNFKGTPGHVSFHISDYYGYHPAAAWGKIALKIIKAKGDPVAMQGIRNHHDGVPWEIRATKTTADDIMACRAAYLRGTIPKKPICVLLGADVGLTYAKWAVIAFTRDEDAYVIDWGMETHPDGLKTIIEEKRYVCHEDGEKYRITHGWVDAKYRKSEVHKACLMYGWDKQTKRYVDKHRLWPIAGIPSEVSTRSITANRVPNRPSWFRITVFVDRDAKHELYTERIQGWVEYRAGKQDLEPNAAAIWFPEGLLKTDDFCKELCAEQLVQRGGEGQDFLPDSAKEYVWKRKGANHWGDTVKVAIVGFRWLTRNKAKDKPETEPRVREYLQQIEQMDGERDA